MLETALAQLRLVPSLAFGSRFSLWALETMADSLRQTRQEFGSVGAEGKEIVSGPSLDEATRREMQLRR